MKIKFHLIPPTQLCEVRLFGFKEIMRLKTSKHKSTRGLAKWGNLTDVKNVLVIFFRINYQLLSIEDKTL